MWSYDKKLEYPIKIKKPDPRMANLIITQYGGPDVLLLKEVDKPDQRPMLESACPGPPLDSPSLTTSI